MSNDKQNIIYKKSSDDLIKKAEEKAQDNFLKQHLIIHGDSNSGKSLLIRLILDGSYYHVVSGVSSDNITDTFYWGLSKYQENVGFLHFDNLSISASPHCFFDKIGRPIKVNTLGVEPFLISPRIILEYKEELSEGHLFGNSIRRRFYIINTNTISYKEIIDFIKKWNNNEPLS